MKDKIIDSVKDHLRKKDIFISNFKNADKDTIARRKISN